MMHRDERAAEALWDAYRLNSPEASEIVRGSDWTTLNAAATAGSEPCAAYVRLAMLEAARAAADVGYRAALGDIAFGVAVIVGSQAVARFFSWQLALVAIAAVTLAACWWLGGERVAS